MNTYIVAAAGEPQRAAKPRSGVIFPTARQ
jgi:hypothetical protein